MLTAPITFYTNLSSTPAFCFGTNTGTVQIDSIYGGVSPYNIQWGGGMNPDSLYAGTYTVYITDSLGCSYIDSVTVYDPDLLIISFSGYTNPLLCNGSLTVINSNING